MDTSHAIPVRAGSATRAPLAATVAMAAVAMAVLGVAGVLGYLAHLDMWSFVVAVPAVATPAGVAVLIAVRRPGNRVAAVLAADALMLSLALVGYPYAHYALIAEPGALPGGGVAALWDAAAWPLFFAGAVALALVFPDGRLPGPRWRPVAAAIAGVFLLSLATQVGFQPVPAEYGVARPFPTLPDVIEPLRSATALALVPSLAAAAVAVAVRLRRAEGVERLQLLWLAWAALLLPIAIGWCFLQAALGGTEEVGVFVAVLVAAVAPPAAVGVALVRHRLFDIELVLSRTLLYSALTAILAAMCLGIVLLMDALLNRRGVSGVVAAVAAALAIQPVRSRLQRRVDRWVYGDRSDPYAALVRLGRRLQDVPAGAEVLPAIIDSVTDALRLSYAAVELERAGVMEVAASRGVSRGLGATVIPLTYRTELVGRLVVEPRAGGSITSADEALLADLARQVGVAAHAVRLTADLQRSRERLVTAREEERRRLRRDLHDGLGPVLAGMVLGLGAAGRAVPDRPADAERLLAELRGQAKDAIAEIRRLVDGLGPPVLDELGLVEALRVQAARLTEHGGPGIDVDGPHPLPTLPAAVEVAAYRIVSEALANVIRHARASRCAVRVAVDAALTVTVTDDGIGMSPDHRPGVGLRSMRERASEVGGTLDLDVPDTGGTRVSVRLPLVTA